MYWQSVYLKLKRQFKHTLPLEGKENIRNLNFFSISFSTHFTSNLDKENIEIYTGTLGTCIFY